VYFNFDRYILVAKYALEQVIIMKIKDISKNLKESFLFKNMTDKEIIEIIEKFKYDIRIYEKGDIVFSSDSEMFSVILTGSAYVIQHRKNQRDLILNKLSEKSSFGMSTLFSHGDKFNNTIETIEDTQIFSINGEDFKKILMGSEKILNNYLYYTSNRIQFLNEKIFILSMGNAMEKLCYFLVNEREIQESNIISLQFKKTELAQYLSIGRQSLYREIRNLENENVIKDRGHKIEIIDFEGLKEKLEGLQ
jgi:CRP-like cAMP-binding protein